MKPSATLLSTIKEYLTLVDSGSVSDERSELHNKVMDEMKAEGFVFRTRDEARELARELTRESRMTTVELAREYLRMCDEEDGHCGTQERNAERTLTHNALIASMVENGLVHKNTSRAAVRWLARYLLSQHEKPDGEQTKVMFARNGTLVSVPPFDEFEESRAMEFYHPVVVTIRAWDGNGLLSRDS